jgi:hypothetical protein
MPAFSSLKKRIFAFLFTLFLFTVFPTASHASDFTSKYNVDYYLSVINGKPQTKVKFKIDVKSNTAQSFLTKFSLTFPKFFKVSNATALYNEPIIPTISTDDNYTKLELNFTKSPLGKDVTSSIYIDFEQDNLFKMNGTTWEIVLPTLTTDHNDKYQITLHLPEGSNKKLSISKPTAVYVDDNTYTWENPTAKTIYTVFGDSIYYDVQLVYHLKNDGLTNGYTEVSFPPDTDHQKVFIKSFSEEPKEIRVDEDGNYIGKYYFAPKEEKKVVVNEVIQVLANPRKEVQDWNNEQLQYQKRYLLNAPSVWNVDTKNDFQSPKEIYSYINNLLSYDYSKLDSDNKRLGAANALKNPDKAVCTEFTDVFVALSRYKGIYSREIDGFGYSDDPQFRPLSLKSDVLHAWPEYYDTTTQQWRAVDPTWQNTSGIDYFDSLDLDHITFAIHGKDPEYPIPAGMYKLQDTKDISVNITSALPEEKKDLKVEDVFFPNKIIAKTYNALKFTVENKGNTFVWNIPVTLESTGIKISQNSMSIPVLAPFQKKEISVPYAVPQTTTNLPASVRVTVDGQEVLNQSSVITPYYYDLGLKIGIAVTALFTIMLLIRFFLKKSFKK